jgi:hypothetical protein
MQQLTEYRLRHYSYPYRANFDKNGEIWASTMRADRGADGSQDRPDRAISDAVRLKGVRSRLEPAIKKAQFLNQSVRFKSGIP